MSRNWIIALRKIGITEGISLLVLLFVAMPLKYFGDRPEAVKLIGWIHGVLFILFMYTAWVVSEKQKWPFKKLFLAFVAAFLPFGTFVFDRQLKIEQENLGKS
jgi:integral membrane protein